MKPYCFTASIKHDKKTVARLNQVLQDTFHKWKKIFFAAVGFLLLLGGTAGKFDTRVSTVFIALGCWSLLLINYSARTKTREMERNLNGYYPSISYQFGAEQIDMRIKAERASVEYRGIVRWAFDHQYVYFFPSEDSVFMLDRRTLSPDDFPAFQVYIQERCKADWTALGATNLETLVYTVKRLKKR